MLPHSHFLIEKAITISTLLLLINVITNTTCRKQDVANIPAQAGAGAMVSVNAKQAKIIGEFIDSNVNPCDDFFAYACSNWTAYHNYTMRYSEAGGFIDHKINKKLAMLLEHYKPKIVEGQHNEEQRVFDDIFRKVRTYYRACKRKQDLNMMAYLKLVETVDNMSMAELQENSSELAEDFDWFLPLAQLRRFGFKGAILEHNIVQKYENSKKFAIELDRASPSMRLPKRHDAMKYFHILGVNQTEAAIKYIAIMQFENKLHDLLEIGDEYGLLELTLADLEEDLPDINWQKYFDAFFKWNNYEHASIQLRNWEYFVEVIALLKETENEVICNYITIMFLDYLLDDATSSFEKIDCIVDVRSKMDFAVNYIYRERFYSTHGLTNERDTLILLEALKYEFTQLLKQNQLRLSETEIKFLKEKLSNVRINFGNLPSTKPERTAFIRDYYNFLQLHPHDYYQNHLALLVLRCNQEHLQVLAWTLAENFVFITDSSTARSSTPYYVLQRNTIFIPYGIFQPPIYHSNMHAVLKLSSFGFLLAHELVHAFDVSGMNFDYVGNLHDIGQNLTKNNYLKESIECLQRRKRTSTIDERLADIVGVRLAYNAYFGGTNAADPEQKVHFSPHTLRRLFFLNLAQYFCGSMKAKFLQHDSDKVRLKQIFMNFAPFAEEFQCQLGDKMYPREPCRVW